MNNAIFFYGCNKPSPFISLYPLKLEGEGAHFIPPPFHSTKQVLGMTKTGLAISKKNFC